MIVVVFLIFCGFYTTCQKSTKYLKKLLVLFFVAKNLFDAQTILDFSKYDESNRHYRFHIEWNTLVTIWRGISY